jgi:hypothetical protein
VQTPMLVATTDTISVHINVHPPPLLLLPAAACCCLLPAACCRGSDLLAINGSVVAPAHRPHQLVRCERALVSG